MLLGHDDEVQNLYIGHTEKLQILSVSPGKNIVDSPVDQKKIVKFGHSWEKQNSTAVTSKNCEFCQSIEGKLKKKLPIDCRNWEGE